MTNEAPFFQNRHEAGLRLAEALDRYKDTPNTLILALPRGGVIVGDAVSRELHLPLEVFVTRKLGAPGNPELAMGALAETGYRHPIPFVLNQYGVSEAELEQEVQRQKSEILRQVQTYRDGKPLPPLTGRTIILVDDGLATGATFHASLAALRALEVAYLVAAVPVAPPHAQQELLAKADAAVILESPSRFFAIGQFYADFSQVSDTEVIACLTRGRDGIKEN